MINQYAAPNLFVPVRYELRGWMLWVVAIMAVLFNGLATCIGIASGTSISSGPSKSLPATQWRPTLILKLNTTPFWTPDASFGPGLAWVDGEKMLAATTSKGLVVWRLGHRWARIAKLLDYHRAGFSQSVTLTPIGVIQRTRSFGVVLFVKGEKGANPRLVVDWYARTNAKFLHCYRIHLRRVRNSGVGIVAPMGANWFATIPVAAIPQARICLWRDRDGKQLPIHLPPLRHRFNFAFSGGRKNEIVWGTPGTGIHIARWISGLAQGVSVSVVPLDNMRSQRDFLRQREKAFGRIEKQIKKRDAGINKKSLLDLARTVERSEEKIVPREIWLGTLSPGGTRMLIAKCRVIGGPPYGCGPVTVVARPVVGARASKIIHYLPPGGIRASPAFSPHARFAAFAVLGGFPNGTHGWAAATDIFLLHGNGLGVVRWARLAEVVPIAISFSGHERKLALVSNLKIFVFDLPRSSSESRLKGLPLSKVQQLPAALTRPPRSTKSVRDKEE